MISVLSPFMFRLLTDVQTYTEHVCCVVVQSLERKSQVRGQQFVLSPSRFNDSCDRLTETVHELEQESLFEYFGQKRENGNRIVCSH